MGDDLAHTVNHMAETWVDYIVFWNAEKRNEWCWFGNIIRGECCQGIEFIGNQMNLIFLTKSHVLDQRFSRITSTIRF